MKEKDGTCKKKCRFTFHEDRVYEADTVSFDGGLTNPNYYPQYRNPKQVWIYFSWESMATLEHWHLVFDFARMWHSQQSQLSWKQMNSLHFNWTMTFSSMSDIPVPYGYFRRSQQEINEIEFNQKVDSFVASFSKRPFDVVWIVSNCQ